MDETEIAKVLQTDLNFYKIKIQVKRKGSQLHVLTTRAEDNDVDYSLLMELVRKNLEKLPLQDTDNFIIYGRVAGAKQPEWQEKVEIRPQMPLIELDIDDLDLGSELNFSPSPVATPAATVNDSLDVEDLLPNLSDISISADTDFFDRSKQNSTVEIDLDKPSEALELPEPDPHPIRTLDSYDYPELDLNQEPEIAANSNNRDNLSNPNNNQNSDLKPKKLTKVSTKTEPEKPANKKSVLFPIAILSILLAAGGGWFLWDRSTQEQKLAEGREIVAKVPDLKQLNKKEALNDAKSQLNSAIARLEEIPERPGSLFEEAQNELGLLRSKVAAIDKKLATLTIATTTPKNPPKNPPKKTDTPPPATPTAKASVPPVTPSVKPTPKPDDFEAAAKHLGHEASVIVQNAPHKSEVWKTAQGKWQEAIALLEKVPKDSPAFASVEKRLGLYKQNLAQITTQLQKQQKVEEVIAQVPPAAQADLKQLKTKGTQKPQFITSCTESVRSIPNSSEVEGATCEYLFKSL
jgi:hypothetical protein